MPDLSKYTPQINMPKGPAGPTSGPDFLERRFAPPSIPNIPTVVVPPTVGGGGGGGGGRTRAGAGGGFAILPIDEGFIGGGGGGYGAAPGNEMLLDGLTGGTVINVTVNAAIAEATLADTIVDALTDYNRRSGPLQLEIA